jgi:hypothetical protein
VQSRIVDITSIPTFYINLDDRKDRRNNMQRLLKIHGFKKVERISGFKAPNRVGCSTSHVMALEHIIENNIYPALILEDDVSPFKFNKNISIPDDADAMYLGISKYGYNQPGDSHPKSLKISELGDEYHRVHNMLARHAIIHFNPEYDRQAVELMNRFISDPPKYVAGDVSISALNPKFRVYAKNEPLFFQNDTGTRGLTKKSIYDCNYLEVDKA